VYRRIEVIFGEKLNIVGRVPTMYFTSRSMTESGLPNPNHRRLKILTKRRPKFFFTEFGWKKCGSAVLSEIRSQKLLAKVIVIKEKDPRINIIYKDQWQVVITFNKKPERK
jgi:hypothetical protein